MRATLQPESVELLLQPEGGGTYLDRFPEIWHTALPKPRIWVEIVGGETARRVRLTVRGDRWSPGWATWGAASRTVRDLEGGQALADQDRVSDDGQSWTVLVRAGETRRFPLDFAVPLKEGIAPGTQLFDVSVADDATGEPLSVLTGSMVLAHPFSRFLDMLPSIYGEEMGRMEEEEG
ncbi:hypothetical protein EON79_16070, partial [bacterium]